LRNCAISFSLPLAPETALAQQMIVWVYYSAIIVFLGAEITNAFVRHHGTGIKPGEYAVPKGRVGIRVV
jgi:hypothetical protein